MILTFVMAAWTQQDVNQVREAIVKLATGERVATVSFAGPPARSVTYGAADLKSLRELLAEMERSVNSAPSFRRASFRKGFYDG